MITKFRLLSIGMTWVVLLFISLPSLAQSSSSKPTESSASRSRADLLRARAAAAVSGGYTWWPPYYVVATPSGIFTVVPPVVVWGQPTALPPGGVPLPVPVAVERGPIAAPPPANLIPPPAPRPLEQPARRRDPTRSAQLVTVGDRLFRGDNIKKAEDRYLQAARQDPQSALPLARLAQVAFVRERYSEACQRLREAETVEPGWIARAPDLQALYGEPTEFAGHLARLETYLQVHPNDREAWLVLGAQWFLSGRTDRAGDVFVRLSDPNRKPDIALAAFLEASRRD